MFCSSCAKIVLKFLFCESDELKIFKKKTFGKHKIPVVKKRKTKKFYVFSSSEK